MGKVVAVTDEQSAFLSLSASILSIITCSMVVISIYYDTRTVKKSYHLRLVQRLLISDIGLSFCVIFYYIIQFLVSKSGLEAFCNVYLPLVIYFFLCSYGWTAMLAFRFRSSHQVQKASGPPIPLWVVWTVPSIFAIVVLISAFASGDVTTVENNEADTNQSCTFNHKSDAGITLDLLTFQAPLLLTIIVNCYSYTKGLLALSNTPHSVVARQMRKAGGYLGVLLLVWVPNIVYNFLTIFDGTDDQYNAFLDIVIFLSSLQGFLNVCVYVWSNQQMRAWFWKHLFCFVLFGGNSDTNSQEGLIRDSSNSNINNNNNRSNAAESNVTGHGKDFQAQQRAIGNNNDNDNDSDDEDSLHASLRFGGHLKDNIDKIRRPNNNNNDNVTNGIHSTQNILHDNNYNDDNNIRDTNSSNGSKTNSNNSRASKSILIPKEASKVSKKPTPAQLAMSADLDNERYVRFGENSTRMISQTGTTPRPSEDTNSFDGYDEEQQL